MQFENVVVGVLAATETATHGQLFDWCGQSAVAFAEHGVFDVVVSETVIFLDVSIAEVRDARVRFCAAECAAEGGVGVTSQEMSFEVRQPVGNVIALRACAWMSNLAEMNAFGVLQQIAVMRECLAAMKTRRTAFLQMHSANMRVAMRRTRELFATM